MWLRLLPNPSFVWPQLLVPVLCDRSYWLTPALCDCCYCLIPALCDRSYWLTPPLCDHRKRRAKPWTTCGSSVTAAVIWWAPSSTCTAVTGSVEVSVGCWWWGSCCCRHWWWWLLMFAFLFVCFFYFLFFYFIWGEGVTCIPLMENWSYVSALEQFWAWYFLSLSDACLESSEIVCTCRVGDI